MTKKNCNLIVYSIFWSFVIGICTATYLNLVNILIDFVWHTFAEKLELPKKFIPFAFCIPMGFIIGVLIQKLGKSPLTIEEVMKETKTAGHLDYHSWWKSVVLGLLSLSAGGSIGPEASTTVLCACMVNWLGDRLRAINYAPNYQWTHVWNTNFDKSKLPTYPRFSDFFSSKTTSRLYYLTMSLIGIIAAAIIFELFPEEGLFGIHHKVIEWNWAQLPYLLIAIAAGIIFGLFFLWMEKLGKIVEKITISPIIKGVSWGLILAYTTLITSYAMYSGEFQILPFLKTARSITPSFLLIIAIVKTFTTNIGFSMGWRGGKIFPAIFTSTAIGISLSFYLPVQTEIVVAVVIVCAVTTIISRPLLTSILLILLLPVELTFFILSAAYIAYLIVKLLKIIIPIPKEEGSL